MKVQILGTGCPKCQQLTRSVEDAVSDLGIPVSVEKVTDAREIVRFGVMSTPALAIDGVVKSAGKVLSKPEIAALLREAKGN